MSQERLRAGALRHFLSPENLMSQTSVLAPIVVSLVLLLGCGTGASGADAAPPDVALPDVAQPDVAQPDITQPDVAQPDVTRPDVAQPDISQPDIPQPDVPTRDVPPMDVSPRDVSPMDVAPLDVAMDARAEASVADVPRPGDVVADATVTRGVVYVVVFTHIEDNSPVGMLGSEPSRTNYLALRSGLIALAQRARTRRIAWVLQPDWKYLEAARMYETATVMMSSNGKNVFRFLHEDLGVAVDPHSHENGGYNYTDVAYLLQELGVGGSTVIGGHIWDPALPQFQRWDRFRTTVAGVHYPSAMWRGDILIGAGTPNHVNDPLASGVWRPQDRDHFFTDTPAGNVVAVGAWHDEVVGVRALVDLYARGTIPARTMLTASWNVTPTDIMAPSGIDTIDSQVLMPLQTLQTAGQVVTTDFTSLVATWRTMYGASGTFYHP